MGEGSARGNPPNRFKRNLGVVLGIGIALLTVACGGEDEVEGDTFADPEGLYSLTVADDWTDDAPPGGWTNGAERFGVPSDGNVPATVTINAGEDAPVDDVDAFLDEVLDAFEEEGRGEVTGSGRVPGRPLAWFSWTYGTGDRDLESAHVVLGLEDGVWVHAQLVASPEVADEVIDEVTPYLNTLTPTP